MMVILRLLLVGLCYIMNNFLKSYDLHDKIAEEQFYNVYRTHFKYDL